MKARTSRATTRAIGTVLAVSIFLAGCSAVRDTKGRPLTTLNPRGPLSTKIDNLVSPVFLVAGAVFVFVEFGALYLIIRYRRRKSDEDLVDEPVQIHGNSRLEWTWTAIPLLLLAVLAVFNVKTLWELEDRVPNRMHVEVIGQQWWWEFRYDTNNDGKPDIITAQQMVIPAGRQIDLDIRSNDVIHSFWIPALNGKKDAVPGHIDKWLLEASKPGLYQGQCTEFCGLSHGKMKMEVKALSASDFDAWVANQQKGAVAPAAGSVAEAGQKLVQARCLGCHQINGFNDKGESTGSTLPDADYRGAQHPLISGNAPNLTHLMSRNRFGGNLFELYGPGSIGTGVDPQGVPDAANLSEWLTNPSAMKPMAPDQNRGMPNLGLSADEIHKIVEYLTTLK